MFFNLVYFHKKEERKKRVYTDSSRKVEWYQAFLFTFFLKLKSSEATYPTSNAKSLACDTANEHTLTCTRETCSCSQTAVQWNQWRWSIHTYSATVGKTIQTVNSPHPHMNEYLSIKKLILCSQTISFHTWVFPFTQEYRTVTLYITYYKKVLTNPLSLQPRGSKFLL